MTHKKIPVATWAAERVGKEWYVREDARRLSVAPVDDAAAAAGLSLVGRMQRIGVQRLREWPDRVREPSA